MKLNISVSKLRALCIENHFFTCGGNKAYTAMFESLSNGASLEDIAYIIFNNSDVVMSKVIDALLNHVKPVETIIQTIIMEFFTNDGQDWIRIINKENGEVCEQKANCQHEREQFNHNGQQ